LAAANPTAGTIILPGFQPIQISAIEENVRVTVNLKLALLTSPQAIQAMQKNQLLLPSGLLQGLVFSGIGMGQGRKTGLGH